MWTLRHLSCWVGFWWIVPLAGCEWAGSSYEHIGMEDKDGKASPLGQTIGSSLHIGAACLTAQTVTAAACPSVTNQQHEGSVQCVIFILKGRVITWIICHICHEDKLITLLWRKYIPLSQSMVLCIAGVLTDKSLQISNLCFPTKYHLCIYIISLMFFLLLFLHNCKKVTKVKLWNNYNIYNINFIACILADLSTICILVQVQLRQVLYTSNLTQVGFDPMTSRSWTVHFMSLVLTPEPSWTFKFKEREMHCHITLGVWDEHARVFR